jgi:hypothetical protein
LNKGSVASRSRPTPRCVECERGEGEGGRQDAGGTAMLGDITPGWGWLGLAVRMARGTPHRAHPCGSFIPPPQACTQTHAHTPPRTRTHSHHLSPPQASKATSMALDDEGVIDALVAKLDSEKVRTETLFCICFHTCS